MSNISWVRLFKGRFATVVRFVGDKVVVAVGGEQEVMDVDEWRALPLAI
jgi:hypothetical protein